MVWSYFCADENMNITADSKEELTDKLVEHMEDMHDTSMTREEARQAVERDAKQTAA